MNKWYQLDSSFGCPIQRMDLRFGKPPGAAAGWAGTGRQGPPAGDSQAGKGQASEQTATSTRPMGSPGVHGLLPKSSSED